MISFTLKRLCQQENRAHQRCQSRGFAPGLLGTLSNHTASDRSSAGGKKQNKLKVKQSGTVCVLLLCLTGALLLQAHNDIMIKLQAKLIIRDLKALEYFD